MSHNDVSSSPDPDATPIRVLVAWRPDSRGTEAIEFAAWLARTTDVRVRAVTTLLRPWPSTSLSKLGGKYRKWYEKEAAACEQKVRRAFTNAGIEKDSWDERVSVFADGTSESVLLTEAADEYDAHLVILGSGATAPKGRFLAGSTADALLHSSPKPLGLAPRAVKLSKRGITRVNFAFLDSRGTEHDSSLHFAAHLAARWSVPLRILAFSPSGIADPLLHDRRDLSSELTDEWREHSLAMLDRAGDAVSDRYPELTVETEIGTGVGWAGAIDALKWKKGDLLCLGSTPLGPIESVFIGSTATDFLRHVRVPVVIHPAPRT
ncbi:universal stress protein [Corynebacterium halotolerans]|uniref:Universal stress protein n=1 Tax=Corynebacterium halotolerans YIM 70093 = DSM 44683 TaxID=1121362 RepID=M1NW40_9CORY|nr:universal stress protein [Corynebacterium halotolerans]AGF73697.1 universal stress protein [Corynebacterium halotolerans YIM 70093 = DSM 44683]